MLKEKLLGFLRKERHSNLLLHCPQKSQPLLRSIRIKQCNVLFSPTLALQVYRQQIGSTGQKKPDHLASKLSITHELRDLREDPVAHPAVSGTRTIPQLGVSFIDNHGNRAHRFEQMQYALEVALGDALPHASEVLQSHCRYANLSGKTCCDKCFPGPYRPADDVTHGPNVRVPGANGGSGIFQFPLSLIVAGHKGGN